MKSLVWVGPLRPTLSQELLFNTKRLNLQLIDFSVTQNQAVSDVGVNYRTDQENIHQIQTSTLSIVTGSILSQYILELQQIGVN